MELSAEDVLAAQITTQHRDDINRRWADACNVAESGLEAEFLIMRHGTCDWCGEAVRLWRVFDPDTGTVAVHIVCTQEERHLGTGPGVGSTAP